VCGRSWGSSLCRVKRGGVIVRVLASYVVDRGVQVSVGSNVVV
jgi:hypothetical protein